MDQPSLPVVVDQYFASTNSLLNNERKGVLNYRDHIVSRSITTGARSIIVDWLMGIRKALRLTHDAYFAAVNILDAFLGRTSTILTKEMLVIGVASLSLGAKYYEISAPLALEYVNGSEGAFTDTEIYRMEAIIFSALGCNINIAQELAYWRVICIASSSSTEAYDLGRNLLTTLTLVGTNFLPSVLVTAIRKIIHAFPNDADAEEEFVNHFKIPEEVIDICVYDIGLQCRQIKKMTLPGYKLLGSSGKRKEWLRFFNAVCKMEIKMRMGGNSPEAWHKSRYFVLTLRIPLLDPAVVNPTRKLGEGTFGVVYRVTYQNKMYAVKETKSFTGDTLTTSFLREVSIMRSLNHPNIARVEHLTSDLKCIFLSLGISDLRRWLDNYAMDHGMQMYVADQLLSALNYIHNMGCLHRDIKPANIIVYADPTGESLRFVLSDFGSSRGCEIPLRNNSFTQHIITLRYRPPEILLGETVYNDEVDVWSMLCTLYECATGIVLFDGDTELDQLLEIFRVLGTPSGNYPIFKPQANFFTDNDGLCPCFKEMLITGLQIDPKQRPRTADLMDILWKYTSTQ